MKVEFEFYDGTNLVILDVVAEEAYELIGVYENRVGEIISGWRDDEPWFGLCTDMREGVA